MIETIDLKFGPTGHAAPLTVPLSPVTIFVGPNNSGKSKVLSEIYRFCSNGTFSSNTVILDNISFVPTELEHIEEIIRPLRLAPDANDTLHNGHIFIKCLNSKMSVSADSLTDAITKPNSNTLPFCQWVLRNSMIMLDGESRIRLILEQPAGDMMCRPENSLQTLFRDNDKRREVRRIVHDAFGLHFIIDPTNLGKLRVRLSSIAPTSEIQERGIHEEAINFHRQALPVEQASDGVRAFTGIICEVIAGDPNVILIDEPEAFLHPALASKLGTELARAAMGSDKRILVSTHSPNFIMGCIQSGTPINIVRLTYQNGISTARLLESSEILELMRNPLLRSTGMLSGLFYESVVVTESDTDRAFYQEINERLLHFRPDWGIRNCLFINAQNKQTTATLIRPLRKMGIPVVGIVDIDVLKDGGNIWTSMLASINMPSIAHQPLGSHRAAIKKALELTGLDMKRNGGLEILEAEDRQSAVDLLDQLADYGLFVVPGGELESWLKCLGVSSSKHGPGWLIEIFSRMGEDPTSADYVTPGNGDVWKFISHVRTWLADPQRKGIPA